jgi:glycosyltransferase involved in cell wall biosynthesis
MKRIILWLKMMARRSLFRPEYPVRLKPRTKVKRGHVLMSYLTFPLRLDADSPKLEKHPTYRRCRTIAQIFTELGYAVDVIDYTDRYFVPKQQYDIVFDIESNLARWQSHYQPKTIKLLQLAISDPFYTNSAELARIEALKARRGGEYCPRRSVQAPELIRQSLEIADTAWLIGNEHTRNTYPESLRDKLQMLSTSTMSLGGPPKTPDHYVSPQREFIWFNGAGAVYKGLDVAIEAFARNPQLILNIVGNISREKRVLPIYERELALPNIRCHGALAPSSSKLREIVDRCFAVVAPNSTEGISSAIVQCIQTGLYPIISYDCGITLPEGAGMYLETCSIEEIEQAVITAYNMHDAALSAQIGITQKYALEEFGYDTLDARLRALIGGALTDKISRSLSFDQPSCAKIQRGV